MSETEIDIEAKLESLENLPVEEHPQVLKDIHHALVEQMNEAGA